MTTLYAPNRVSDFTANNLNFKGTGVAGTATAGTTTSIDYQVPEDRLVSGIQLIIVGQAQGDKITLQVIDKDGILTPAGTILREFATDWYIIPDQSYQPGAGVPYPAKCIQGLYLRILYTSVGSSDVSVMINYEMHKVLA